MGEVRGMGQSRGECYVAIVDESGAGGRGKAAGRRHDASGGRGGVWAEPDALLICARLLEIKRSGSRSVPKSPRAARFERERMPGRFTASGYSIRTDMAHLTATTILDRCGLGRCGEFCREL